jgi:glycosyltransferase involved in cell wall biosynthesis
MRGSWLVELYNGCDVLLFPSHHEGYGWPPLEAMACGTPVVASECEALLEVCGGVALHAPANEADALASQVRRAVEDADVLDRLRWAGIERAAQCSWQRTIDGFERAYLDVADATMRRAVAA